MEAAGHGEPPADGHAGKPVSEDSDSREGIIELDQSQIASASDSEEERQGEDLPPKTSDPTPNNTADSEYFDAVSDDEIPDDDDDDPTPQSSKDIVEVAGKSESDVGEDQTGDKHSGDSLSSSQGAALQAAKASDLAPASSKDSVKTGESVACGDQSVKSSDQLSGDGVGGLQGTANIDRSALGSEKQTDDGKIIDSDSGSKDAQKPDIVVQSETNRTDSVSTLKVAPTIAASSQLDKEGAETSQLKESVEEAGNAPSDATKTTPGGDLSQPAEQEQTGVARGVSTLSSIVDDMSDVSSEGQAPLSPVLEEDQPSAEKLFQEAAHQAEALAPLGAEPVSEPESGEDMGSDESSPVQSPGFNSPVVVTSTSRISLGSGDYADIRARATSRSPRKSDSAVISDSASSIQPTDRLDRLSLDDGVIPATFNTTDNKIDLSAMDMENISDDENIGEDNDTDDTSGEIEDEEPEEKPEETVNPATQQTEEDSQKESEDKVDRERVRQPIMIASLGDKQQVQTHFNEEQVELDYEDVDGEGEGDDGEIKADDEDDGKEEGEDSDKDEGEIDDDDDCEEGEIKEPGITKKPFVKPTCRFFQRGTCTWGLNCRFLHPGVNDKGNYQMIELPGQRWNGPPGMGGGSAWGQEPEEPIDLPPPPEVPPVESAWERGLRHAKEQMKKASQRKEQESNFEEKRLNLSVDEEREMNKENERRMVHTPIVKDPYYDQAAFDEEEYYKQRNMNHWQTGRYENFEVRYNRESYSPYRKEEYYPPPPVERYPRHFSPPVDKFGRHPRAEGRPQQPPYRGGRMEDMRAMSPSPPEPAAASPPSRRPADEWHDPWRRSKSPKANRRGRSRSRSRRGRRSLSDSSFSSDSRSGSRSSGSHSSGSRSRSSGSSRSRSQSSEPAPPGVERGDRNFGPPPQGRFMDGPRSAVSIRGRDRGRGRFRDHDGGRQGYNNRMRGQGGRGFQRDRPMDHRHRPSGPPKPPDRSFPPGYGYNRPPAGRGRPAERRIPSDALRPKKPHSASSSGSSHSRSRSHSGSGSSSSYSGSRSRSRGSLSRSRSGSSVSSRSSSSSSSSSGSADSDNLYRDLGGPSPKKKTVARPDRKRPADPATRRPGEPVPRRPGEPVPRRPGEPVPRRPGESASRRPGAPPAGAIAPGADHPVTRPPRSDARAEGRADTRAAERAAAERREPPSRIPLPSGPDRSNKAERAPRPERPERAERNDRDRAERAERVERERALGLPKPAREQSSRPPPPSMQPKAKDPMKLMGLKSNIKLSLVSKQPSDKAAAATAAPPSMKRRLPESGEAPPAKRPVLPSSPVKMPSEKAAKPSAGRERARSPSERQPRSGTAATPASLPQNMAASIPLPPSPTKPITTKPRPPAPKPSHPPPPVVSAKAPPQPVPPPAGLPPSQPARAAPGAGAGVKAKKSTTSRREELLKQLKAVEDAIARKKAKMQ